VFRIMSNRPIRANAGKDVTTLMQEELRTSDTSDGWQKKTAVAYFVLVDRYLRGSTNRNMKKIIPRG
jgi:hypothetical protein